MDSNLNLSLPQGLRPQPIDDLHFEARLSADARSSSVDHGCSLSVMSYITFAAITVSTVININNVSSFHFQFWCSLLLGLLLLLLLWYYARQSFQIRSKPVRSLLTLIWFSHSLVSEPFAKFLTCQIFRLRPGFFYLLLILLLLQEGNLRWFRVMHRFDPSIP